jgi:2-polyprenyl-6-methoxyphenol hydroxylase-like FAD-dependent oxidoreductase
LQLLEQVSAVGTPLCVMLVSDQTATPIMASRRMTDPALMITRSALQNCLRNAVTSSSVFLDDAVETVEQNASGVTARFYNGRTVPADLFIDASGIWSPTANAIIGGRPAYRGYGGVVALSDRVESALAGVACEYWGRHQRFGLFEIAEGRRYWFYMRTQAENAPPPDLKTIAQEAVHWPAGIAEAIAATPADRLIPFAIHAKAPPRRLGAGRIICVGDAAHAMEPNLGQGACQALEDAAALQAVAGRYPIDAMLPAFEALRLERVRSIVGRAAEARGGAHGSRVMQSAMRTLLRLLPNGMVDHISRDVHTMPDYR